MTEELELLDEKSIKDKIYFIRGKEVMLDSDLAKIYGYTTTRLNEQVHRNISKFDEDFMFRLTEEEFNNLISHFATSSWGGKRYLPYVFTEQGIYMLMTVLKGEKAVNQSKALIRIFKKMKDFVIEYNNNLISYDDILKLSLHQKSSDSLIECPHVSQSTYQLSYLHLQKVYNTPHLIIHSLQL